jgi:tetratricopeptide (TPR) repeat protein
MKIIEVGNRTKQSATTRTVAANTTTNVNRVRIDPKTSPAARHVERKSVRRPVTKTDRTTSTRISRTETLTTSTRTRADRRPSPRTTTVRNSDTTIVSATELGTRSPTLRHRRTTDLAPRIVVNGDNNVIVQGDVTATNPRPRIRRHRLARALHYINEHSHWRSHSGIYFSFAWSSGSCGRVAYLPYRYHHSWCDYPIGYRPYYGLSYYYPYYHRKYVFVSIGGYWPTWYRYRRYYWYGCHPYYWYGSHIITEPYQNVTYNTYNYYNDDNTQPQPSGYGYTGSAQPYYNLGEPKSEDVLDEPEYQTPADLSFENGVKLFEAGNYEDAVRQFREAVSLAPEDVVLPFTYSQALFANGEYALAATVLREAMNTIPEDELTIYYPRGLYDDETRLDEQIKQLENAIAKEPFDTDFQLLLGYQYLGKGDLDKAYGPLTQAAKSPANTFAAGKLLELAAKLEAETKESE